jgi:hypothetical protein
MRILIQDFFLTFRIGNTGHVTSCFTCYCTERLERGTEGASTGWGVRRGGGGWNQLIRYQKTAE